LVIAFAQVPLMTVLPSAMGALAANREALGVAQYGVGFLLNLSLAEENKVTYVCVHPALG
jgi:hypothetical protein